MTSDDKARDPDDRPDRGDDHAGGSGLAESVTASNAETVLDPDAEPREPEEEVADSVDRLERHNRAHIRRRRVRGSAPP